MKKNGTDEATQTTATGAKWKTEMLISIRTNAVVFPPSFPLSFTPFNSSLKLATLTVSLTQMWNERNRKRKEREKQGDK